MINGFAACDHGILKILSKRNKSLALELESYLKYKKIFKKKFEN